MSKAELIEFLQKKFQIDQILISSLPVMLKPETNESQVEMAQFNWKKIEEELLLNIIST